MLDRSTVQGLSRGIDFAVCAAEPSGFTMRSSDMDIEVEYLEASMNFGVERECPKTALPISVTSVGQALLTGKLDADAVRGTRKLKAAFDFSWGRNRRARVNLPEDRVFSSMGWASRRNFHAAKTPLKTTGG